MASRNRFVIEAGAKQILAELETLSREGLQRTPARMAKSLLDLTCGYDAKMLPEDLTTFNAEGVDQMVAQTSIQFASLCEHHVLPFVGYAHIGYIPRDKIVGLSKFKRVIELFSRRLQIQERLTRQICDFISAAVEPRGVIVVLEAEHLCMTIRGVQAPGTRTITSAVTGDFLDASQGSREEFMSLVNGRTR